MVTDKETAIAKEYLAGKTIKGIWVNSQGELFSSKELAIASDEDAEYVRNITEVEKADAEGTNVVKTDEESKDANLKLLEETALTKQNYKVMQSLVKAFEIKTADNKAETLIEALTKFKADLKLV